VLSLPRHKHAVNLSSTDERGKKSGQLTEGETHCGEHCDMQSTTVEVCKASAKKSQNEGSCYLLEFFKTEFTRHRKT